MHTQTFDIAVHLIAQLVKNIEYILVDKDKKVQKNIYHNEDQLVDLMLQQFKTVHLNLELINSQHSIESESQDFCKLLKQLEVKMREYD